MFAGIEAILHRLRRHSSRNEWAIRHLGLTPSEGTSEIPGLLLIQIDGLARQQFESALTAGRMPFLRQLLQREGYELRTFYSGIPSTTPAVQAELFYGIKAAVPSFSFFDRTLNKLGRMWDPDWAKARESACMREAEGLLKGGSSWSNIYTGGAAQEESHFCAASIGLGDMWRSGKIRNIFLFIVFHLPAALRIFWLLMVELAVSVSDGVRAIAAGRRRSPEIMLMLSRVFIGVGLRELLTISGEIDVTRGLPIVHINFVGYDEQAHVRGPASRFAQFGLRGIDGAIRKITRAAHRSRRRDYAVWIFSDHGQEPTRSLLDVVPGGVDQVLLECLQRAQHAGRRHARTRPMAGAPWLTRRRHPKPRAGAEDRAALDEGRGFIVAAMGPVGHVYFTEPRTDEQRRGLARALLRSGKIPGVLLRDGAGRITWFHSRGESRVPDEVPPLLPHPPALRQEIARDMVGFCEHPDAGDLILLGWSPWESTWSFAPERGAHGGFGPAETQGFALLPAATELPPGADEFLRPLTLRTAALHHLGRSVLPPRSRHPSGGANRLRLMTYNVHGCSGMDGRVSPRRVARVIAGQAPDLVALQEIDLGRRRSRAEDQAALIAHQLGLHVVFCPTVTREQEHYGHALLSRWPIEIVKRKLLPHDPRGWWKEPRAALWARVWVNDTPVHVVTTHLGLGRYERMLQMRMLLSHEWLGGVREDERILLCGDFNLTPGSAPYGLMAARLQDAQSARDGHRPLSTFSSNRPFARLDHVFTSRHFNVQDVRVPRSELTRVASDHLPLVVDFEFSPAAAETPTRTSP